MLKVRGHSAITCHHIDVSGSLRADLLEHGCTVACIRLGWEILGIVGLLVFIERLLGCLLMKLHQFFGKAGESSLLPQTLI